MNTRQKLGSVLFCAAAFLLASGAVASSKTVNEHLIMGLPVQPAHPVFGMIAPRPSGPPPGAVGLPVPPHPIGIIAPRPKYILCHGTAEDGVKITLVTDGDNTSALEGVRINGEGQSVKYNLDSADGSTDVSFAYKSKDHGGLNITFYDEDTSASGYSKRFGKFKAKCDE